MGEPEDARIPTGGVSKASGEALAAAPGDLTLILDTSTETTKSRNVIAQTKTGATDNVVVVGAHLDSVPEGPGINDNGSGTAAVLETALQMGSSPSIENAVRFAFWGAEEVGLVGSTRYVEGLSDQERADIALYLNFDMLGSPNAGYLAYDGDNSDAVGEGPGPEGSAGIERTFVDFLAGRGLRRTERTSTDGPTTAPSSRSESLRAVCSAARTSARHRLRPRSGAAKRRRPSTRITTVPRTTSRTSIATRSLPTLLQ
ncbi:hypothetical protein GCM10020255_059670 [Rhodococcus baikonurensis]